MKNVKSITEQYGKEVELQRTVSDTITAARALRLPSTCSRIGLFSFHLPLVFSTHLIYNFPYFPLTSSTGSPVASSILQATTQPVGTGHWHNWPAHQMATGPAASRAFSYHQIRLAAISFPRHSYHSTLYLFAGALHAVLERKVLV